MSKKSFIFTKEMAEIFKKNPQTSRMVLKPKLRKKLDYHLKRRIVTSHI
ncbi:MAG: hypothetical protein ABIK93_08165 [candidate division WOR-3 bacterium]